MQVHGEDGSLPIYLQYLVILPAELRENHDIDSGGLGLTLTTPHGHRSGSGTAIGQLRLRYPEQLPFAYGLEGKPSRRTVGSCVV